MTNTSALCLHMSRFLCVTSGWFSYQHRSTPRSTEERGVPVSRFEFVKTPSILRPGNLARTWSLEYANVRVGKLKISSDRLDRGCKAIFRVRHLSVRASLCFILQQGSRCTTLTLRHCNVWARSICSQGGSSRPSIEPTDVSHNDAPSQINRRLISMRFHPFT